MYNERNKRMVGAANMCCEDMHENVFCVDSEDGFSKESQDDKTIYYSSKFNEYGIPIHDGEKVSSSSYILIHYCPWCGEKLPQSRRDEWFDRLEKLGFDYPFEQYENIPSNFKSSKWYSEE